MPVSYTHLDVYKRQVKIRTDDAHRMADIQEATSKLMSYGVKNAIITLGSSGAVIANSDELIYTPCVDVVEVKDPTAAGDSFVGSFCTGVCSGMNHQQAMDFANYTATLTVSRMGAQPSLPQLDEVIALMKQEHFSGFNVEILNALK